MLWNLRVSDHVHKNQLVNRSWAVRVQYTPLNVMCLRYISVSICSSKLPISVWLSDNFYTFLMPCRVFRILCTSHPCQSSEAYEFWPSSLCNVAHPFVTSCLLDPFSSDLRFRLPSNCFLLITKPSSTAMKTALETSFGFETGRSELNVGKHMSIHSARNFGDKYMGSLKCLRVV